MSHECELQEQPSQPALSVRTRTPVGDLPQAMGRVYGAIAQYLGEMGEQPAGPPYAAYHNMDMQDLDVEMGFPVARALPGRGEIQASEIPAGQVATCLHIGPYSDVGSAYEALSEWIAESGYTVAGAAYEFYLNDPGQTPPQELQTRIAFPVRAA